MPGNNLLKKVVDRVNDARARHRERHKASGYGFAFADSIAYLPEAHWDVAAASGGFFMSRPYLQILEQTCSSQLRQRYALIYLGARPLAAVCIQMGEISAAQFNKQRSKLRGGLERIRARYLICGNLLSWGQHGVSFAPGIEPVAVWPAVAEALYRIRRSEKLIGETDLVMVKDIAEPEMPDSKPLRRYSYRSASTGPNMILTFSPQVKSFEDYLASLNNRYRKSAKQILKEIDAGGCTVETLKDLPAHADALHRLYLQVHEKAKVRPVTLPANYLSALAGVAGAGLRCTVIRKDGAIIAFVTTLKDGDTAIGYFLGLDYALNAQFPLYFRLLLAVVQDAIELGCRTLSLGRTALEPKAKLGAKPVELKVWLRHRIPALNYLMRNLLVAVPHETAPERNPFKS